MIMQGFVCGSAYWIIRHCIKDTWCKDVLHRMWLHVHALKTINSRRHPSPVKARQANAVIMHAIIRHSNITHSTIMDGISTHLSIAQSTITHLTIMHSILMHATALTWSGVGSITLQSAAFGLQWGLCPTVMASAGQSRWRMAFALISSTTAFEALTLYNLFGSANWMTYAICAVSIRSLEWCRWQPIVIEGSYIFVGVFCLTLLIDLSWNKLSAI